MPPVDIQRHHLLAAVPAALASSAGLAAPHLATNPRPGAPLEADVIVVGAGLPGLVAARRLKQAGRSVIVLEARDRVGWRTWSHEIAPGCIAELGGTWVGPTQDRVLALAKELGLTLFDQYTDPHPCDASCRTAAA